MRTIGQGRNVAHEASLTHRDDANTLRSKQLAENREIAAERPVARRTMYTVYRGASALTLPTIRRGLELWSPS